MKWITSVAVRLVQMRRRWLGLLAGCVLWLAWMLFGFWQTLLLIFLALVGYIVGRVFEERNSWKSIVEKLLSEHYPDR